MKKHTKKILTLLLCGFFYGCQTTPFYINEAMKAKDRGFEDRLPNLEVVWENEDSLLKFDVESSFVRVNTPESNKFYREFEKNLIDSTGDKKGYLVLTPVLFSVNGRCFRDEDVICMVTCVSGIITIPLAPFCSKWIKPDCEAFTELEARVLDKKGNLIKKYSAENGVRAKEVENWRKQCTDAYNCRQKTQWLSYENALENLINQIYNDRAFLKRKLLNQN